MPLFDEEKLPNAPRVNPIPLVQDFGTARINTEDQPVGTLLTHIGGMRQVPRLFFSQLLGANEIPSAVQLDRVILNRQTRLIHNLEIKVQTPINNPSFDNKNQEAQVRGQAIAYPNTVIPNAGDMFIDATADGREILYQVCDTVEVLSIYNRRAYRFEFIARAWVTNELEKSLMEGVQEEYYFVRDNIDAGMNPLIATADYGVWEKLWKVKDMFPPFFTARFFSKEYNTYLIPGQPDTIYDPFHAAFIDAIFGYSRVGLRSGITLIPTEDGSDSIWMTIHTVMLTLNMSLFNQCETHIPVRTFRSFLAEPFLGGIRFAGTRYVIYPEPTNAIKYGLNKAKKTLNYSFRRNVYHDRRIAQKLVNALPWNNLDGFVIEGDDTKQVEWHEVFSDNCYIFSEAFYSGDFAAMSKIESMIWTSLKTNMINPNELLELFVQAEKWPILEQFYYLPFMYALIPAALRGV